MHGSEKKNSRALTYREKEAQSVGTSVSGKEGDLSKGSGQV